MDMTTALLRPDAEPVRRSAMGLTTGYAAPPALKELSLGRPVFQQLGDRSTGEGVGAGQGSAISTARAGALGSEVPGSSFFEQIGAKSIWLKADGSRGGQGGSPLAKPF